MTMRWFGDGKDTVSLEQIRQVPGVVGVVPALHTLPAGEVWPLDMILDMKKEIEAAGLTMECIESVNVHESIKLGMSYDEIAAAIAPHCTKVQQIKTAESFDAQK